MRPPTESDTSARGSNSPRRFWHFTARDTAGGSEGPQEQEGGGFVSYPTNRVVGTIADAQRAEAAVDALLQAGFDRGAIEVLQGETGLHRLDPAGGEHGVLAHFQRRLIQFVGEVEEQSLKHHADDLRKGKLVVMVLAKKRQQRIVASEILNAHGAEFVGFYSRWFWESLDARGTFPAAAMGHDPVPGQMYEAGVGGAVTRLRYETRATAIVSGGTTRSSAQAAVVPVRPGMRMLSWRDPQGLPVVQVHDYETGRVYAVVTQRDGSILNFTGSLRRLT